MKLVALTLLLLQGLARARDPVLELGAPTFSGSGCANADAVTVELSSDGAQLLVAFPPTFAVESAVKRTRVACNGAIPVTIPTGFSVGITREGLEGDVVIPLDAAPRYFAQATTEVFFAKQQRGPKTKQRFETPGAVRFRSTTTPDEDASVATTWSVCGGTATLRINAAVSAHGASISGSELRYAVAYKLCTSAKSDHTL